MTFESFVTISLTQFLDYASAKDPSKKRAIVKSIQQQMGKAYTPGMDYYKPIREAIQKAKGKKVTKELLNEKNYIKHGSLINGYNKFIGRKAFEVPHLIRKKRAVWSYGGLNVKVNPEITLSYRGVTTYYKLYFKSHPFSQQNAKIAYQMIHEALRISKAEKIAILDVRNNKTIFQASSLPNEETSQLLEVEAEHFMNLWNRMNKVKKT